MLITRFVIGIFSVGLMVPGIVFGQDYPNRPIRIVTAGVGGGSDFTARLVAQGISGPLGQQVVVVNYPSGVIPGQVASKSPPDGYTLIVGANSLYLTPFIQDNVPYDPVRDFLPITAVATSPIFIVVHPSVPVKSVKELIALAKARPGELNYASGTTAGSDHLAAELFKAMAGVNIVRIAYKSSSIQMADLIGGHTQLVFGTGGTVTQIIKSGRLKALAVSSAKPSAVFPDLPTVAATLPGYETVQILGIWAPAKTPAAIIVRLNQEIVQAINLADIKKKFLDSGQEIVGNSPEQFAALIKSDMAKMGKVIKDAGIRAD